MADARAVGLHEIVEIIDNGSDAPGTLLDDCSQEFKRRFAEADLILAKGQGNFETLSDEPHNIFFLLKAKCSVIAAHAGVPIGTHVLGAFQRQDHGLGRYVMILSVASGKGGTGKNDGFSELGTNARLRRAAFRL